jgi:16S rRNA (adenine1518-N6/adenine1519-N6)-dimethyltransferase
LNAFGIKPKKRLGQHFLMDGGTAMRIARLAAPTPGMRAIEIGAGTGALTAGLLALGAQVTAIDVDDDMIAVLRSRTDLSSVHIEKADALAFDYAAWAGREPWVAAGNLPYNIATPLMLLLADLPNPPDRIVAMIQKDVADRLTAKPHTPSYGSLTIAISVRMQVERAFNVSPSQFYPRPNVNSAVVVMKRHEQPPVALRDPAWFERVVRGAFGYRRKTAANALALALDLPREQVAEALRTAHLNPESRAEELDLVQFAALADALAG